MVCWCCCPSLARKRLRPSLLNPIRFISACAEVSRNMRGRGFPDCGNGVTVPSSRNPKPSAASPSTAFASLSSPAARPTGLGNERPIASTGIEGSGPRQASTTYWLSGCMRPMSPMVFTTMSWAVSGLSLNNSGRTSEYIPAIRRLLRVPDVATVRAAVGPGAPHQYAPGRACGPAG